MKRRMIAVGVFLLGAAFVAVGLARGEAATVFQKAVQICMDITRPFRGLSPFPNGTSTQSPTQTRASSAR